MFERIKTETCFVGVKKAEELLKLNTFEGQRPLRLEHAQFLVGEMTAGRFTRGSIGIAEHPQLGRLLVNGQHQCTACKITGSPFFATIDTFKTKTNEDLWRLYATFDTHKGRSESNIMQGARGLFSDEELRKTNLRVLQVCGSALSFIGDGEKPTFSKCINKSIKVSMVQDHAKDVANVRRYSTVEGIKMLRVGVVLAIIVTFRKNPQAAGEFWDRVIIGDQLKAGSPQYKLRNALKDPSYSSGCAAGNSQHAYTYKLCISWWNSYRCNDGRKIVQAHSMKDFQDAES